MLFDLSAAPRPQRVLLGILSSKPENKESQPEDEEWKLDVSVKQESSKEWKLNFTIEYQGKSVVMLGSSELPWKWREAMTVCAVAVNGQRPIPFLPFYRVGDPPMRPILVKPGEALRGEVTPLAPSRTSSEEFRRWPVIVFWSYKIKSSNRVGGWFEVDDTKDISNNETRDPPKKP